MVRRALVLAVVLLGAGSGDAWAHASLQSSDPAAGTTLDAAPRVVRLAFAERPDAALSDVRVLDRGGAPQQTAPASAVAGDPRALAVGVQPLDAGVYTVRYRAVAAEDGHVTAGALTFGVRRTPGAAVVTRSGTGGAAPLEVAARVAFMVGVIALLGGAVAAVARFGSDRRLCAAGWALAAAGLAGLAAVQASATGVSLGTLLDSSTGRGLLWRAAALAAAGATLLVARHLPRLRRGVLAGTALVTLGAMGADAAAGHAGTSLARVGFQVVHFGAAGVWVGGLVALLLGVRGAPSAAKAAAVRRFSRVAAGALALVMATGALRAVQELPSAGDLFSSDYGRAILVKTFLVGVVIAVAFRNRTRSVPEAARDLGPLRSRSRVELAAAAGALLAAGTLGSVAPPVAAQAPAPGLVASGSDAAQSLAVRLTAASSQPGPNTFVAEVRGAEVRDVRLRFTALDDPDVARTTLALRHGANGAFVGTGANLRFDGRWRIDVLAGTAVVPLEVTTKAPPQFLSVLRVPGRAPQYTRLVKGLGYLRVTPHRRPGRPARIVVRVFDIFEGEAHVDRLRLTDTSGGVTRQEAVRRLGPGRFAAAVELGDRDTLSVIALRADGSRMRSTFDVGAS
jgi:copper transport protein